MDSKKLMLKFAYFFLIADGKITDEENAKFDEILVSMTKDSNGDVKKSIIEECNQILSQSVDEMDRYEVIREEFERLLPEISDRNGSWGDFESLFTRYQELEKKDFKKLLWMCVNISYADGVCSQIEERLLRFLTRRLKIDISLLLEMEDSAQTLIALEKKQFWAENSDKPYSVVKSIIEEITQDKENVIQSLELLIA